MDDRVFGPLDFIVNPQPFKKLFIAGEDISQGGDKQGFSKAAGPGEKKVLSAAGEEVIDILGFIHVQAIAGNQF